MSKQLEKLIYKLLVDALSLALFVFFLDLIAEGLAPGYISGYLSFTKLLACVIMLIIAIAYLGKRNNIFYEQNLLHHFGKNKITFFLVIVGTALIINSLHKLGWIEIGITTLAIIIILYYFFRILFLTDKK